MTESMMYCIAYYLSQGRRVQSAIWRRQQADYWRKDSSFECSPGV